MPFPGAKYPPTPACHEVTVHFYVNARTWEEARLLLEQRLPDPTSDGHAVIDCWQVHGEGDA